MDEREVLRKLAEDKIVALSGRALGLIGDAAARLLADVYAVGLAHGITPENWAAVSALPGACWDTSLAQARQHQRAAGRAVTMSDQRYLSSGSSHVPPPSQGRRGAEPMTREPNAVPSGARDDPAIAGPQARVAT